MFNLYKYAVVEVDNPKRVHLLAWSIAQAQEWIETVETDKLLDDYQIVIWG